MPLRLVSSVAQGSQKQQQAWTDNRQPGVQTPAHLKDLNPATPAFSIVCTEDRRSHRRTHGSTEWPMSCHDTMSITAAARIHEQVGPFYLRELILLASQQTFLFYRLCQSKRSCLCQSKRSCPRPPFSSYSVLSFYSSGWCRLAITSSFDVIFVSSSRCTLLPYLTKGHTKSSNNRLYFTVGHFFFFSFFSSFFFFSFFFFFLMHGGWSFLFVSHG